MKNSLKIGLLAASVVLVAVLAYYGRNSQEQAQAPAAEPSVVGCYVATLGKDVYTMNLNSQIDKQVSGMLSFKNFEKDSSNGTFLGVYNGGLLVADYFFASEGMDSKMQVIFRKEGDNFVRGFGPMDASGEKFADFNNIKFDPKQTFAPSADCV